MMLPGSISFKANYKFIVFIYLDKENRKMRFNI